MVTFMPGSAHHTTNDDAPNPNATWIKVEDIPAFRTDAQIHFNSTELDSKFRNVFNLENLNPIASTALFSLEDAITCLEYLCGRAMHLSSQIPGTNVMRELRKQWKYTANTWLEDFRRNGKTTIAARGYELLAQEVINECHQASIGAVYDLRNMDPEIWMSKFGKRFDPLDVQDAAYELAEIWDWHTDTIDKLLCLSRELSRSTYSDADPYLSIVRSLRNYARRDYDKIAMELGDYRELRHRIIRHPAMLTLPTLMNLYTDDDPVDAWMRQMLQAEGTKIHDAIALYPEDFVSAAKDLMIELHISASEARRALHGKGRATN